SDGKEEELCRGAAAVAGYGGVTPHGARSGGAHRQVAGVATDCDAQVQPFAMAPTPSPHRCPASAHHGLRPPFPPAPQSDVSIATPRSGSVRRGSLSIISCPGRLGGRCARPSRLGVPAWPNGSAGG